MPSERKDLYQGVDDDEERRLLHCFQRSKTMNEHISQGGRKESKESPEFGGVEKDGKDTVSGERRGDKNGEIRGKIR